MKYSLGILKNKFLFKRHNILPQMHWTSNIFGHSATTIVTFQVSLNYPIVKLKKKWYAQKTSGCSTALCLVVAVQPCM